jgi:hypothetical protein
VFPLISFDFWIQTGLVGQYFAPGCSDTKEPKYRQKKPVFKRTVIKIKFLEGILACNVQKWTQKRQIRTVSDAFIKLRHR